MSDLDFDALERIAQAATQGEWHPGCFSNDDHPCECRWVLSEGYCGSICQVSVDNGISISEGGNDSPPAEEAKANLRHIAAFDPPTVLRLIALARLGKLVLNKAFPVPK